MDFSKLTAIVFGVIFIVILYFIIYYSLKIMYKDVKGNGGRRRRPQMADSNINRSFGIEVISAGQNPNLKKGTIIPIKDEITIGRKEGNSLILGDKHISGNHAVLTVKNNYLYLKDLNSTNGTFVNGKRIVSSVKLIGREEIQIGTTVFKVLG